MNHETLFSDKSDIYKRSRPSYPDSFFKRLACHCSVPQRAWDCACGSGQASEGLAQEFAMVDATDISDEQLANAHPRANIRYQKSSAEQTPFTDNSFDLVCVAQALHWFDYQRFWPEVKRVLKPDGVFAAWGYNWPDWGEDLSAPLQTHFMDIIEPYFAPHNRLLWDHYRDVELPFKSIEKLDLEMTVEWNLAELFDMLHSASATRVCMRENGDGFFNKAQRLIADIWGDPSTRRTFHLDTVCLVAKDPV